MKSIRLSLIVYFLVLLGAALGSVSFLVYRITSRALQEKHATNRQLLETQYDQRRREELAKTDNDLLEHARALANLAQWQFEVKKLYTRHYAILSLLTAAPSPQGHFVLPLWIGEEPNRLRMQISGMLANEIKLDETLNLFTRYYCEYNGAIAPYYFLLVYRSWLGVTIVGGDK